MAGYRVAHLDEIPAVRDHGLPIDASWKPVRHHLGIEAFGMNAYVAQRPDAVVIEDHVETDTRHQELYFVTRGHARFSLGAEELDAPAGSFVFFADPALRRRAVALEPSTAVLAVGARPGEAFRPSEWESRRTASLPVAGEG